MLTKHLYVQIRENEFNIRDIEVGRTFRGVAEMPFSHQRMIIGNFTHADQCLKKIMKQVNKSHFTLFSKALIHPLDKTEGGLSQIEERSMIELLLGCGATTAYTWTGRVLTESEVLRVLADRAAN